MIESVSFSSLTGIFAAAYDVNVEWLIVKGFASDSGLSQSSVDDWKSFASTMAASLVANILSDSAIFQEWPHCSQGKCYAGKDAVFLQIDASHHSVLILFVVHNP